jgi:carbon storage regulator
MLVLTKRHRESIMIGDEIEISVLSISDGKVRIGIEAPREIPVFRREIYAEVEQQRGAADSSARAEVNDALKRLRQR